MSYGFNWVLAGANLASITDSARMVMLSEVSTFAHTNLTDTLEVGDYKSPIDLGDNILHGTTTNGVEFGGTLPSNSVHATGKFPDGGNMDGNDPTKNVARHFDGANYLLADGHVKWYRSSAVNVYVANQANGAISYFRP